MMPTKSQLDPNQIRVDFPILQQQIHGHDLIYFDNAATTQKPRPVLDAIYHYYTTMNANIHRGVHELAERATTAYEDSRRRLGQFINARSTHEIIFTKGTTEAINLVASAWGGKFIQAGDEIVLSEMEHHSNLVPWQLLAAEKNALLKFIPVRDDGTLDLDSLEQLFTGRTRLVAITHMSNVLGTINPIKHLAQFAHERGVRLFVDGAQSAPHLPVDVQDLDCDFFAFSGHKMLAPTGIGVLYGKAEILNEMTPYQGGGEMIANVTLTQSTWNALPYKFEAGTPHIEGAIVFGTAIDYLSAIGMDAIREHEIHLTSYALQRLSEIDGITIYGRAPQRGGVIAFNLGSIHAHDLAHYLNQYGIAMRSGHHCAEPISRKLSPTSVSLRMSFYIYNTTAEVDRVIEILKKAKTFFA